MEINANFSFNDMFYFWFIDKYIRQSSSALTRSGKNNDSIFSTLSNYYFMYLVFMQLMKALQPIMSKRKNEREKKRLIFL